MFPVIMDAPAVPAPTTGLAITTFVEETRTCEYPV